MESVDSSSLHGHKLIQKLRMAVYDLVTKIDDQKVHKVQEEEEEIVLQDPEPELDEDDRDDSNEEDEEEYLGEQEEDAELLLVDNNNGSHHKRRMIQVEELGQQPNKEMILDDTNPHVRRAIFAIERMLTYGLRRLDGKKILEDEEAGDEKEEEEKYKQLQIDTVDLWGLIQWTNHVLLQKHMQWLTINQPSVLNNEDKQGTKPVTSPFSIQGYNASLRTVHSLSNVQTPLGKLRAWLRRCLNTHVLGCCIESILDESNMSMLQRYYNQHAVCLNPDTKEIFFSQLKMLDRMRFAFKIDDASFDDVSFPFRLTVEQTDTYNHTRHHLSISACSSSNSSATPSPSSASSSSLFNLLESKLRAVHTILKATPSSILSPLALGDDTSPPCQAKTFGRPMKEIVSQIATCDLALLDSQIGIPNLVEGCCRIIDASVTSKDLFCTQIEVKRFRQLAQYVEKSGVLSIWSSVHHAIVILIKFLRDLPTSIFNPNITSHILEIMAASTSDEQEKLKEIQALLNDPEQGIDLCCRATLLRILQTLQRCLRPSFVVESGIQIDHITEVFGNILFPKNSQFQQLKVKKEFIEILIKRYFFLCEPMRLDLQRRTQMLANKIQRIKQLKFQLNTPLQRNDPLVQKHLKNLLDSLASTIRTNHHHDRTTRKRTTTAATTWREVGFYHNDPYKELQGGGLLVVYALQVFVTKYQQRVAQILEKRLDYTRNDYPFPNTSVHVLRMVLQVLGMSSNKLVHKPDSDSEKKVELWPERWLQHCDQFTLLSTEKSLVHSSCSSMDTSSCQGILDSCQSKWLVMDEETGFYELFCMSMFLFDHFWTQSNANWMDFPSILEKTKSQLDCMFQLTNPTTYEDMWTITESILNTI